MKNPALSPAEKLLIAVKLVLAMDDSPNKEEADAEVRRNTGKRMLVCLDPMARRQLEEAVAAAEAVGIKLAS